METNDRLEGVEAEAPVPYSPPAITERTVIDARLVPPSGICL